MVRFRHQHRVSASHVPSPDLVSPECGRRRGECLAQACCSHAFACHAICLCRILFCVIVPVSFRPQYLEDRVTTGHAPPLCFARQLSYLLNYSVSPSGNSMTATWTRPLNLSSDLLAMGYGDITTGMLSESHRVYSTRTEYRRVVELHDRACSCRFAFSITCACRAVQCILCLF